MEPLVGRGQRADEVVVDAPVHGCLEISRTDRRLAPLAPGDQQGALRVGVEAPRVGEERRRLSSPRRSGAASTSATGAPSLGKLLEPRRASVADERQRIS